MTSGKKSKWNAPKTHAGLQLWIVPILVATFWAAHQPSMASKPFVEGSSVHDNQIPETPPQELLDFNKTTGVNESLDKLPLYFIENQGQLDRSAKYYLQGKDTSVYFAPDGITFVLTDLQDLRAGSSARQHWAVKLDFIGASNEAGPVGEDPTTAVVSYFKGGRDEWKTGLPTYHGVVYRDLWPGIDLVYSGTERRLKYTFVVQPGADPNLIRLTYRGATDVQLTEGGRLAVTTPVGGFEDDKPYAYQDIEGTRIEVPVGFDLDSNNEGTLRYGFHVGDYDETKPLILDPVILAYCGYIGGNALDQATDIAVDDARDAYVTGSTQSLATSFPETVGPFLGYSGNTDAFVAKVNADGTALVYCGYIGGSNGDVGRGIAVLNRNAYITGHTSSSQAQGFPPASDGSDLAPAGFDDAFVIKVSVDGTALDYCVYLGGNDFDYGHAIAVDNMGRAYIAGETRSNDFPVNVGPFTAYTAFSEAFVTRLSPDGSVREYSGYLGGSGDDRGYGVAVDGQGRAYVTGETASSADFPVQNARFPAYGGGFSDAFVTRVTADGSGLDYSTYFGGLDSDIAYDIAVDDRNRAHIVGVTTSDNVVENFPTVGSLDATYVDNFEGFVARWRSDGSDLEYSGYVGGTADDFAYGVAVDTAGSAYVVGHTQSDEATLPVKRGPDLTHNGGYDVFVAKVRPDGSAFDFLGYIGGGGDDYGYGIDVDYQGKAYVTGYTGSDEVTFPVKAGPDLTYDAGFDAFVAKVDFTTDVVKLIGFETGDESELVTAGTGAVAENVTVPVRVGSGQYYLKQLDDRSTLIEGLPLDTLSLRFSFLKPASLDQLLLQFLNGATPQWSLWLRNDGRLMVQDDIGLTFSPTPSPVVGTTPLADGTWYTIRLIYDAAAGGAIKVWLGASHQEITVTHASSGMPIDWIEIWGPASGYFYDDIYLADSLKQPPLGQIVRLSPDSDGDVTDFNNTAGFTNVNEIPPVDGSNNYHDAMAVANELYNLEDFTAGGDINAVKGMWRMSGDAGADVHHNAWKESGIFRSEDFPGLTTGVWSLKEMVWSSPPSSGGTWTQTKVDDLQLGARHNLNQSEDTFISWTAAMVDYEASATASCSIEIAVDFYAGDGSPVPRAISGLGFKPDVVIIKADGGIIEGVIRTATMSDTKSMLDGSPPAGNRILSFDADGFSVGNDPTTNSGFGYYWTAFKSCGDMKIGTFVGNGIQPAHKQSISGLGFSPDYVIIVPGAANRYVRHRTRYGGATSLRTSNNGFLADSIISLDPDGFTVQNGNMASDDMNTSGQLYHYIAFNEVPGKVKVGEYRGDGADDRDLPIVGFQPDYLLVQSYVSNDEAIQKSTKMVGDFSMNVWQNPLTNLVQAFLTDGFQVGDDSKVNENNEDYAYVAFSAASTTAVDLLSFTATGFDREVLLEWETASEVDNLGFYLYRAESIEGPYERVNEVAVPGLGSSPVGARYRYVDSGLVNGKTYHYELEDFEASGKKERHGPVSATPVAGTTLDLPADGPSDEGESSPSRITYGDPESVSLQMKKRGSRFVVLELETGGFYAEPQSDGSVRLFIPGFAEEFEAGTPAVPVKRSWVEALAGTNVRITSVRAKDVAGFSLRPSAADAPAVEVSTRGAIRATRRSRRGGAAFRGKGLYPEQAARILSVGFQEDVKKALLEIAPLRWDRSTGQLLLARHLEVQVVFDGRVVEERSLGGSRGRIYRKRRTPRAGTVVAHLATQEKGLYGVRFEDVFGTSRRAVNVRLSRRGEAIPYYILPNPRRFGPASVLYFVSEGERLNPYGKEAVYELEVGREGESMEEVNALPSGPSLANYRHSEEVEENHYISIDSEEEPYWIWDVVMSGGSKTYGFEVSSLTETTQPGTLTLWLKGVSGEEEVPTIRVRVYVNQVLVSEASWAKSGVQPFTMEIAAGVLREGENTLVLENASPSRYTALILDRFHVSYPRMAIAEEGALRGVWMQTGTAEVTGLSEKAYVLEVTQKPQWLTTTKACTGGVRFRAEANHEYLVISESSVLKPDVRRALSSGLKNNRNRADYIIVGPREMLPEAAPLLKLRRSQGLMVRAVAIEDVYTEFGYGEARPEGIQEFLRYAYHEWGSPQLRYVVLLGDGTYDYKNYLGAPESNQVPPKWEKTTWMWTASDPAYARVNGDDVLPDIAIGRLPATTVEEARVMVEKIVAYEASGQTLSDAVVLVADNPDEAGDFEADAEDLAEGVLSGLDPRKIYLRRLGSGGTRVEIQDAMNEGASLVSYLGHGAVHIWAHENIFNTSTIQSLLPQEKQPLVLTINCLNGFFHYPHFDALAEELVKAEGKGAVAAFSPSGLSLNTPAHRFHRALLEELLGRNHENLGDAILAAQARYAEEGSFLELLGIFHLFGDPAMVLHR